MTSTKLNIYKIESGGPLESTLTVVVGSDRKAFLGYLKKNGASDDVRSSSSYASGMLIPPSNMDSSKHSTHYHMWLEKPDHYIILHECLHLTAEIFDYYAIDFSIKNQEMIAMTQMWWFEEILKTIKKKK